MGGGYEEEIAHGNFFFALFCGKLYACIRGQPIVYVTNMTCNLYIFYVLPRRVDSSFFPSPSGIRVGFSHELFFFFYSPFMGISSGKKCPPILSLWC